MADFDVAPLVVDVGPLRERFYTGIPNVIAEICGRLLKEDWLRLYFDLDGKWIDNSKIQYCLEERSGSSLSENFTHNPPASDIRKDLSNRGDLGRAVALYTDHRPPQKKFIREGKIVYDLSMILAPECHPATSVSLYTADLEDQLRSSDVLFCISNSTLRDIVWLYNIPPQKLKIMPLGNAVNLKWANEVRHLIGSRKVEPFLLVLGSMEPRKNAGLILDWIRLHPEILDKVRIVFAGRPAWGETFAELVLSNSLVDAVKKRRIVFTGFISEEQKGALLVGASALLYPSIFEGFGLPLLEAMAVGTPILVSASTSMPEVVGECGYYFDPCDVSSLHSAFKIFWDDWSTGAIHRLTDCARKRAAQFSYDAAYESLIAGLFPDR